MDRTKLLSPPVEDRGFPERSPGSLGSCSPLSFPESFLPSTAHVYIHLVCKEKVDGFQQIYEKICDLIFFQSSID